MGNNLFVESKVKEYLHAKPRECNLSSEVADEMNNTIKGMLDKACNRAKMNDRKTVMPRDL